MLIEGHDREPFIKQPWHPPYYQRLCEEAGLSKAVDLWMWELHITDRSKVVPALVEMAEKLEPEHGIRIRKMSRRRLRRELDLFGETYNEAWKDNLGFVPYTEEDLDTYAQDLQLVFDKHWFMVAEKIDTGESVGVAITVPDINQVLKKMNGRLLPFGWWHFLRRGEIIDRVRVGFLGVKPEYQHTGVAAGLYIEHFDMADRDAPDVGRDGLDPGDQRRDEPRHGGHGRPGRQAVPGVRAPALAAPEISTERGVRPGSTLAHSCPSPPTALKAAPSPWTGSSSRPRGAAWPRSATCRCRSSARRRARPPAPDLRARHGGRRNRRLRARRGHLRAHPGAPAPLAARGLARRRSRLAAQRRGVDVQATRSFLVDVHLLKR